MYIVLESFNVELVQEKYRRDLLDYESTNISYLQEGV